MNKSKADLLKAKELRERAEELNQKEDALSIVNVDTLSKVGIKSLIHELQVHQIELELQNDELRHIQEELEISRTNYFGLYNMAPVGYITLDDNGIIKEVNLTFCNLLNYPKQDLVNKPITQFILPADQDILYKFKKQLQSSGNMEACELRVIARDGIQHWVLIEATREIIKDSEDYEYHYIFSDISFKKHADELLSEQFRLLQALINSPQDLIFSLDKKYRYTAFNKHYRDEMEKVWDTDVKIGDRVLDYMSIQEAAKAKTNMDRVLKGERYVNTIKTDQDIYYEIEWNPIFDDKSEVTGLTAFARDITARKEAEDIINYSNIHLEQKVKERTKELRISNDDLDAFSASVAHDLTSPLRTVEGFSQILSEDYDAVLDSEAKRLLAAISQAAVRMHDIIGSLLDLAKISRCELKLSRVNVKQIVMEVWHDLEEDEKDRVDINVSDMPEVMADKHLFKVIFENLLSNAVKFTSNKQVREVSVFGTNKGKFVEYCVADTGAGFNMAYYDKLFKAFHRLHCDYEFEGTGIGLSIVDRIVRKHGGEIRAISEEGKGASFYFTLPAEK